MGTIHRWAASGFMRPGPPDAKRLRYHLSDVVALVAIVRLRQQGKVNDAFMVPVIEAIRSVDLSTERRHVLAVDLASLEIVVGAGEELPAAGLLLDLDAIAKEILARDHELFGEELPLAS